MTHTKHNQNNNRKQLKHMQLPNSYSSYKSATNGGGMLIDYTFTSQL